MNRGGGVWRFDSGRRIRVFGEPVYAMLAFSNFGHPLGERTQRVQEAVRILDSRRVDFEYDGEMGADVALNRELMAAYPSCRLKNTANMLIMPALHSAAISTRTVQELGGPTGDRAPDRRTRKPVQIVRLGAKDSDIVNTAARRASTSMDERFDYRTHSKPTVVVSVLTKARR